MATTSYTIYSHYDPKDRERLERETGQIPDETVDIDPEEAWRIEASLVTHKKRAPPPQFVPATFSSYDDWGSTQSNSSNTRPYNPSPLGNSLAGWYRSLNRSNNNADRSPGNSEPGPSRTSSVPPEVSPTSPARTERTTKNNWFIMKAIRSEPPSVSSTPAPTLADILERDPPPLPTEEKFEPPVWLEIGPSNRGFAMLQRSGWNEGEALGPDIVRRRKVRDIISPDEEMISALDKEKRRKMASSRGTARREIREIKLEDDEISELRNVNVIDLTLSDSDEEDEPDEKEEDTSATVPKPEDDQSLPLDSPGSEHLPEEREDSAHGRKALLTPIATVLKSDRLGIGLKAKTIGPYKASQKRVTHNAAAMAAHIRAAEEIRKQKKDVGRGRRGFERQRKKEEANRQMMLAYLKN